MAEILKGGNIFYGDENYPKKEIIEKPVEETLELKMPILANQEAGQDNIQLPVTGGRSSVPDQVATFAPLGNGLLEVPPDFPIIYLSTLENLAAYHPDVSYAIDNIIQLANTEHDISFDDSIPDRIQIKMRAHLKAVEGTWYQNSSGISSLKADLLAQVAINGALSAEWVPKIDLSGVKQAVKVGVKQIRFFYNKDTDSFDPYQLASYQLTPGQVPGLVELNKATYHYIGLRRFFHTPYATPPFISAIDSLLTQKDMMESFKSIMKKLGMLGFFSAYVTKPVIRPGETQEDYFKRCQDYLVNVVYPQLQKSVAKGFSVGFREVQQGQAVNLHEFKVEGNNMNTQGAADLWKLIQSRNFAAFKQDPNMNGVNEATTETFGRVVLVKMLSQTREYQQIVDSFFEYGYLMELRLAGFNPGYVKVKSKSPIISDQLKDAQADQIKIANVLAKRNAGIITQDDAANELDYDEAAEDGDLLPPEPAQTLAPGADNKTNPSSEPKAASNMLIRRLEYNLFKHVPAYDYGSCECCKDKGKKDFAKVTGYNNVRFEGYISTYFNAIHKEYKKAVSKIAMAVGAKLIHYDKDTPLDIIQRELYLVVLTKWQAEFIVPMNEVVENNITKIYDYYRSDKTIFGAKTATSSHAKHKFSDSDIPAPVLDLDDYRAIEYMEQSDEMYLGKFITDPDTKKAVYKYLQDEYVGGYMPIGADEKAINEFVQEFSDTLNLEAWKIRRIIDTSVNKVRNYANVNYLSQAQVTTYEVIEVDDQNTCEYCLSMNGKQFSVSTAKSKVDKEVNAGPGAVATVSPFLTTLPIDDVKQMSAEELSAAGFSVPPYHPYCKGSVAASFDS